MDPEAVALTGSAGVCATTQIPGYRTTIDDIDLVAVSLAAVKPTVATDFLVSHFHSGPPKFTVQLVDPQTRLRIDVFPDEARAIERASRVEGVAIQVLGKNDMAAHKMQTVGRASATRPVDPKHWRDLLALCGTASELPETWFAAPHCSTDLNARCERCEISRTPEFCLAPKEAIFELLGYV